MRLRPVVVSLHDLKKNAYTILRKYHSLEKGKRLNKIYSKKYNDEYYVVLVLKHLRNVLQFATEFANSSLGKSYIDRLELFYSKVNTYAISESRISRVELASILKSTTKIFNSLLAQQEIKVIPNEKIHKEWTKCLRANNTVWGNIK